MVLLSLDILVIIIRPVVLLDQAMVVLSTLVVHQQAIMDQIGQPTVVLRVDILVVVMAGDLVVIHQVREVLVVSSHLVVRTVTHQDLATHPDLDRTITHQVDHHLKDTHHKVDQVDTPTQDPHLHSQDHQTSLGDRPVDLPPAAHLDLHLGHQYPKHSQERRLQVPTPIPPPHQPRDHHHHPPPPALHLLHRQLVQTPWLHLTTHLQRHHPSLDQVELHLLTPDLLGPHLPTTHPHSLPTAPRLVHTTTHQHLVEEDRNIPATHHSQASLADLPQGIQDKVDPLDTPHNQARDIPHRRVDILHTMDKEDQDPTLLDLEVATHPTDLLVVDPWDLQGVVTQVVLHTTSQDMVLVVHRELQLNLLQLDHHLHKRLTVLLNFVSVVTRLYIVQ